jgi:NADPH2:quinone reductase
MKAIIVRNIVPYDQAEYGVLDDPRPGPGEVVVDVIASDTNFPDILYIEGKYQNLPPLPFSPGLGGAGQISALGEGVDRFAIGQKVVVLPHYGTYAEKVVAPAKFCFPLPESMSFDVGAALGLVYQTAYFALTDRASLRQGDVVLVLGASGGIGMAAVQLAKAMGAKTVIAATRGVEGAAFARKLGADATVDTAMNNLRDGLRDAVMELTDGHGADVVIDPVGGELNAASLRAMAWCGRIVVVGFASGDIPKIGANYLLVKNISASGIQWTDYRERQPDRVEAAQKHIFDLWEQGKLHPQITRTMPLELYAEALADLRQAKARGKIILLTKQARE